MHCETREIWPFSGIFVDFRVVSTSGGYLLRITSKDSEGTEQMDAEGLGRKLLLTPSADPRRAPDKQREDVK